MASYFGTYTDSLAVFGAISLGYITLATGRMIFRVLSRAFWRSFPVDLKQYGRWAVVTGCTDGIGKSYAKQLAEKGMDIVLISRNPQKLSAVAEEISQQHNVALKMVTADFKKTDVYDHIRKQLSGLDIGILVNNVGMVAKDTPNYFCDSDDFEQMSQDIINVNVVSCVMMTAMVLPDMLERKRGLIINISSGASVRPLPFYAVYCSTKIFIRYFSEALNMEYSSQGVTVQVVSPNMVVTNLTAFFLKMGVLNRGLLAPTSDEFVRKALRTIGHESSTGAHWPHELQQYFTTLITDSHLRSALLRYRNKVQDYLKTQ